MTRSGHVPRNAPLRALTLSCKWCDTTVTARFARDPGTDDGWPTHRCLGGLIAPFTNCEDAHLEANHYRPPRLHTIIETSRQQRTPTNNNAHQHPPTPNESQQRP